MALGTSGDGADESDADAGEPIQEDEPSLFPPGPLASVRMAPAEIAVAPGRERRIQAVPLIVTFVAWRIEVAFAWSSDNGALAVVGDGVKPLVRVQPDARPGLRALITVTATQGEVHADGVATVVVTDRAEPASDLAGGIPEPELVDDPGGRWRSRFDGQRWQVNASHDDYIALRGEPRTRLRYLLSLFAKEVALRAHGVPGSEAALESLVEILAHAERNLASPSRACGVVVARGDVVAPLPPHNQRNETQRAAAATRSSMKVQTSQGRLSENARTKHWIGPVIIGLLFFDESSRFFENPRDQDERDGDGERLVDAAYEERRYDSGPEDQREQAGEGFPGGQVQPKPQGSRC